MQQVVNNTALQSEKASTLHEYTRRSAGYDSFARLSTILQPDKNGTASLTKVFYRGSIQSRYTPYARYGHHQGRTQTAAEGALV